MPKITESKKPTTPKAAPKSIAAKPKNEPKSPSKHDLILALLNRIEGATLADMVAATGWLPHTTRAMLTGLKKRGHSVASAKADGIGTYVIAPVERATQ